MAASSLTLTLTTPFLPGGAIAKPKPVLPHIRSGGFRFSCRKEGVHPDFHDDAKVYCNGELVMTTGGTQREYNVDVWSGNHPFYLGSRSGLLEADRVEKFRKRFAGMGDRFMEIPNLKYGEIVLPTKKKGKAKK